MQQQIISETMLGHTPQHYPVYELLLLDESKEFWSCFVTVLPSGVELVSEHNPILQEQREEVAVR